MIRSKIPEIDLVARGARIVCERDNLLDHRTLMSTITISFIFGENSKQPYTWEVNTVRKPISISGRHRRDVAVAVVFSEKSRAFSFYCATISETDPFSFVSAPSSV